MIIKTRRYQLEKKTYIRSALWALMREQWWYAFFPLGFILLGIVLAITLNISIWWFLVPALLAIIGYPAFWAIQFTGLTQMEQSKIMFDKMSYEITSQQIMIKLDERRGSPIKWELIQKVYKNKDHYLFILGKGQLFHFPFKIFNNDNEVRFVETILKRKGYLK
jgi:hypothetical protein